MFSHEFFIQNLILGFDTHGYDIFLFGASLEDAFHFLVEGGQWELAERDDLQLVFVRPQWMLDVFFDHLVELAQERNWLQIIEFVLVLLLTHQ